MHPTSCHNCLTINPQLTTVLTVDLHLVCDLALYLFPHRRKTVFPLTRGIVQCFNLLVFLLQVVHPGLALVAASTEAAFLKFYGYAFPNVFLTTHGCEVALNIFFCPKTDEFFRFNKAPILCFPSNQRNATVRHLEVAHKNHDRNYLARWF